MGRELGLHLAARTKRGLVQHVEIFTNGPGRVNGIDLCGSHSSFGVEFCLFASASIRLASMAMRCPLTRPSSMQRATVVSNKCRSSSLSRNRPCRFLEKVE
jgi:hypothetical protein